MPPSLTVVVVAYDMARELPRTLATLAPGNQRGIDAEDYEVLVVDNGSPDPVDPDLVTRFGSGFRLLRIDPAPPSPARAANRGIAEAAGDLVGLVVDGARLSSPGLLGGALRASGIHPRPIITASAWHLGPQPHTRAHEVGYDQTVEDALLASVPWQEDGYSLFSVATFAASSWRGLFGPMGESSSLFLARELWEELGGLDERFDEPGGGLVNHDLYHRACSSPGTELIALLGEGTFHQYHGGASTSAAADRQGMRDRYRELRGRSYRPPEAVALQVGVVHPTLLPHVERSVQIARERGAVEER